MYVCTVRSILHVLQMGFWGGNLGIDLHIKTYIFFPSLFFIIHYFINYDT